VKQIPIVEKRFWNRPLFRWRCLAWFMLGCVVLGEFRILGFHQGSAPVTAIFMGCAFILLSICDAVDALTRAQVQP
jgi:hypothetical protein